MLDLSTLKNALHDIIFGVPFERDFQNHFVLPQLKRPERGDLLVREMQLKNQRATDTLTGEWARYPEDRFWNELRYMYQNAGLPIDANRVKREYENMLRERKEGQAARARKAARDVAERKRKQQENLQKQKVDNIKKSIEWPSNPKYQGHDVKPSLCTAEYEYIACPPQNVPTLFEEKAVKIKPYWLRGRTPTIAASNLGKGYGAKIIKYYYDMFDACSEQKPSTPS